MMKIQNLLGNRPLAIQILVAIGCMVCFMGATGYCQSTVSGGPLGGSRYDYGRRIAHDGSDAAYVLGEFRDSADMDPGVGVYKVHAAKYQDIYLSKYSSQGALQWAFALGDTFKTDSAKGVSVGPDGNVVIGGQFSGTIDADPGSGASLLTGVADSTQWNSFIAKYSASGQHLWAKRIGNPGQVSSIQHLLVDDQGAILVVGSFRGLVDFDPGPGTAILNTGSSAAGWIGKYDASGNLLWVSALLPSGTNKAVPINMAPDNHGNTFVTGYFTGTVDFDPGPSISNLTASAGADAFIMKLTSAGQLGWAYPIGGSGFQSGTAVAYNGVGGVYFGGDLAGGQTDFDTGPWQHIQQSGSVTGQTNGYLAFYDSTGVYRWVGVFACDTMSQVVSLRSDSARGVVVGGNFQGNIDFDLTTSLQLGYSNHVDMFAVRIGVLKGMSWGGQMGGPFDDRLCDMDCSPRGKIFNTGNIVGTVDLDITPSTYQVTADGGSDGFVSVNTVCQSSLGQVYSAYSCHYYYWLITGLVFNESGVWFKIYPNDAGCDSTLTLYLTLGDIDTTVSIVSGQLTALSPGDQYQWLDCSNSLSPIPGATSQSFTPSAVGSYAAAITLGDCVDTTSCHTVTALGAATGHQQDIMIHPNPGTRWFIVSGELNDARIEVVDLYGRPVGKVTGRHVDLEGLAAGTYWVRVQGSGGSRSLPIRLLPQQ